MGNNVGAGDVDIDIGHLVRSIARKWWLVLGVSLAAGAGAYVWATTATPLYRAETRLLIEPRESVFTRPADNVDTSLDSEGVSSQVEVISSSQLLQEVARELDLASLEEFSAKPSALQRLLVRLGLARDPGEIPTEEVVLMSLREKLDVYRVENSRVIVISFSSADPDLAARVPNAIADAYVASQRAAKMESNESATDWLAPEIEDLRERVRQAESKVAEFRARSNLLLGQNNTVLATQELSELTSELSRVRAARSAAEARARAVRLAVQNGAAVETLPEVQASQLVQRLRERQVELRAQIAELSTTLMSTHPRVQALQSQLADLNAEINAEARRILAALDAEAEAAREREEELAARLEQLKQEVAKAEGAQVELRALEREAASERELLESYLTRFREAAARLDRNYLPVDARIFSRATPPALPYYPKPVPMILAAVVGTMLLMAVLILLRELFSGRAFRPASTALPMPAPVQVPEARKLEPERPEPKAIAGAVDEDASAVAPKDLDVKGAALTLMVDHVERVIVLSPEGDAASVMSVGLARELADRGLRVVLLDLTLSGAATQPMLETLAHKGITDLLTSEAQFSEAIHSDLHSSCHIVPVGTADPSRSTEHIERLPIILGSLSAAYDVVVIECGQTSVKSTAKLAEGKAAVVIGVVDRHDPAVTGIFSELEQEGMKAMVVYSSIEFDRSAVPTDLDAA